MPAPPLNREQKAMVPPRGGTTEQLPERPGRLGMESDMESRRTERANATDDSATIDHQLEADTSRPGDAQSGGKASD